MGVADLKRRGKFGHQVIHLGLLIPAYEDLSARQKALISEFTTEAEAQERDKPKKSFLRKIKDLMKGV
jgi:DnaJ-class molecular chaperone